MIIVRNLILIVNLSFKVQLQEILGNKAVKVHR